jgi:hypothetical protein
LGKAVRCTVVSAQRRSWNKNNLDLEDFKENELVIEPNAWATIDSAPRDGRPLILWVRGRFPSQSSFTAVGRFNESRRGWLLDITDPTEWSSNAILIDPSHWLSLPASPSPD